MSTLPTLFMGYGTLYLYTFMVYWQMGFCWQKPVSARCEVLTGLNRSKLV